MCCSAATACPARSGSAPRSTWRSPWRCGSDSGGLPKRIVPALWHRAPGRPVSENGRLCRGDGNQGRGNRATAAGGPFMLPSLRMYRADRGIKRQGVAAYALSALDIGLWDLVGKVAGLPLYKLWGAVTDRVPAYGSGGWGKY